MNWPVIVPRLLRWMLNWHSSLWVWIASPRKYINTSFFPLILLIFLSRQYCDEYLVFAIAGFVNGFIWYVRLKRKKNNNIVFSLFNDFLYHICGNNLRVILKKKKTRWSLSRSVTLANLCWFASFLPWSLLILASYVLM